MSTVTPMALSLRLAVVGDAAALGGVLGRAFADDPIWTGIYPQPDRSSALIRHVLDAPSNRGEAADLETVTEANVPFYRRHGFEVVKEVDVPRGGPHLWLMWPTPTDEGSFS